MKIRIGLMAGLMTCAALLSGCGGTGTDTTSGEVPGSRLSALARTSGCRTVCPTCAPGTACPRFCVLQCPDGVVPCGPSVCQQGQVCCNESCGICTPPDDVCTQQFCAPAGGRCVETALCIQGFRWSPTQCQCVPGTCAADADCRVFSDYCTCECRTLAVGDPDPTCSGPGLACVADPCFNQAPSCVDEQCTTASAGLPRAPHAPHQPQGGSAPTGQGPQPNLGHATGTSHLPRRPHVPGSPLSRHPQS